MIQATLKRSPSVRLQAIRGQNDSESRIPALWCSIIFQPVNYDDPNPTFISHSLREQPAPEKGEVGSREAFCLTESSPTPCGKR